MKIRWMIGLVVLSAFVVSCKKDDPNAQLNKETNAIDNYIKAAGYNNVGYAASGLRMALTSQGNGAPPHSGQNVKVTYTGKLLADQSVFSAGVIDDKLDNVLPLGLKAGLSSIPEGSNALIFIPSTYGYGSAGSADKVVPGNATLVYEVTLEQVTKTPTELIQFKLDTAKIQHYLDSVHIQAIKLPSGLFYTITGSGSGKSPKSYDNITIDYKGTILSNGSVFGQGTSATSNVNALVDGLKIGLPLMSEGGAATFYIPSGLAYGPDGSSGTIGANANLIFEIKLNSVY